MDSAINDLQKRLGDAVSDTLSVVERDGLRRLQTDMYKCSARCSEDTSITSERVQTCIEGCGRVLQNFHEEVSRELETFQNRFQRCAMDCQDKVRDAGSLPSDSEFQNKVLTCLTKCTDDHIKLVGPMGKRLETSMNKAVREKLPH
eukprot:scpid36839/ scgid30515/ Protein FAM136A